MEQLRAVQPNKRSGFSPVPHRIDPGSMLRFPCSSFSRITAVCGPYCRLKKVFLCMYTDGDCQSSEPCDIIVTSLKGNLNWKKMGVFAIQGCGLVYLF
uniref:Uncharacterized protein n=1 Tax=Anguilla anguilla TaxID=7936 RepID=A0A0E9W663_ANGAN